MKKLKLGLYAVWLLIWCVDVFLNHSKYGIETWVTLCASIFAPLVINAQYQKLLKNKATKKEQQPVDLPVIEPSAERKKNGTGMKLGVKIFFVFFLLFIAALIGGTIHVHQNPDSYQRSGSLAAVLELSSDEERAMVEIFTECGIGPISKSKLFNEGDTESCYYLSDDETTNIIVWVSTDKTLNSIYYSSELIYSEGVVLDKVSNHYVHSSLRSDYRYYSQELVKKVLNFPDTAKFPIMDWAYGVDANGYIMVQSTVTAKNAFGMESTSSFQVKYDGTSAVSLIMDGVEYLK